MKLFFWNSREGNFGDDLNTWIWDVLLPGWRDWDPDVTFFGVGTLLNSQSLTGLQGRRILVAGTGVGYGLPYSGPIFPEWDIRSLRGPLSARALGLDEALGLLDPAIMIPEFPEFRDLPRTGRALFVPHIASTRRHNWAPACDRLNIDFISPSEDSKRVIRALAGASLVLAESMHAAIIADAFRVPWIPVSVSGSFNGAKWQDWARSLGMQVDIKPLFPAIARLGDLLRRPESKLFPAGSGKAARSAKDTKHQRPHPKQSLKMRARVRMESVVLTSALRRAMERTPNLSDRALLQEKRDACRQMLESIRNDYAEGQSAPPFIRLKRSA
jgi:succinoglycan biosynthesis protein ExoV